MFTMKDLVMEMPKPRYIRRPNTNLRFFSGCGSRPCSFLKMLVTMSLWIRDFVVSKGKMSAQQVTPERPPANKIETGDDAAGSPLITAFDAHFNDSYTAKYTPDPSASRRKWNLYPEYIPIAPSYFIMCLIVEYVLTCGLNDATATLAVCFWAKVAICEYTLVNSKGHAKTETPHPATAPAAKHTGKLRMNGCAGIPSLQAYMAS